MDPRYDAIVVGAGFSGLSCAVRLGMMGKKVILIEKHKIFGGLNSYYTRKVDDRKVLFDSGLHALTNFCGPKDRHLPLGKVIRQLRLSYNDFKLCPQKESKISFPWGSFRFNNDSQFFFQNLKNFFPNEMNNIDQFCEFLKSYDEFSQENFKAPFIDARDELRKFFTESRLIDVLLVAPLCYGSAREMTLDWNLFICLFRSIFIEGLSRPKAGIQGILRPLTEKLVDLNITIETGAAVTKYLFNSAGAVCGAQLSNQKTILGEQVYCSSGIASLSLVEDQKNLEDPITFVEVCLVISKKDLQSYIPWTLHFETLGDQVQYKIPTDPFDQNLLIWSCSANYLDPDENKGDEEEVSFLKLSLLANGNFWIKTEAETYQQQKNELLSYAMKLIDERFPGLKEKIIGHDAFTPRTIKKYTGHHGGAVYGGREKWKDGISPWKNLYIIGADQGPPGIVGSMLSGITMANQYGFISTTTSSELPNELS
ncbi:MAG: NAD(P)-binding protein [Bacteriovoracaceae bacterium]|nr:NAD(P)-binding protein [Bacteriovoracaceae bacterium]